MVDVDPCMEDTRTQLLADIEPWAESRNQPVVFWLSGLAGTGKSTVARTVCERLSAKGLLGASFFVSKQVTERREVARIVRTLSYQLARRDKAVAAAMCATLRDCPDLATSKPLHQHISDLLVTSARVLPSGSRLVIVIDALDECTVDTHGREGGNLLPFSFVDLRTFLAGLFC
jgi:hypothetical protein